MEARKNDFLTALFMRYVRWNTGKKFKEINIFPFEPKPGHSVLLLTNHFSFWEVFFTNLTSAVLKRSWHGMIQQDQNEKHWYLRYFGGFAVKKKSREMLASLTYAAGLLDDPRNLVAISPQGGIYSNHETNIHIEKGIYKLIQQVKGPCQVIYHCILIDFFEGYKIRAYIRMYDCGLAGEFTFDELKARVNAFHQQALTEQINVEH
jgi:hypothetical protein